MRPLVSGCPEIVISSCVGATSMRVSVRRASSGMDIEGVAGMRNASCDLPQYLISATLGCATAEIKDLESREAA